jgi:hypothetical protein
LRVEPLEERALLSLAATLDGAGNLLITDTDATPKNDVLSATRSGSSLVLASAVEPFLAAPPGGVSVKVKDALLKRRLTHNQIGLAYDYLTRTDHDVMGGMLGLASYGGRINTVAPDVTAAAQRGSILDIACTTGWLDPLEEAGNLTWVRAFYRELFAESGGVPVPGEAYDGAFINHPDVDLVDLNQRPAVARQIHFAEGQAAKVPEPTLTPSRSSRARSTPTTAVTTAAMTGATTTGRPTPRRHSRAPWTWTTCASGSTPELG